MELIRECTVTDARQAPGPPKAEGKPVAGLEIAGLGCGLATSARQAVAGPGTRSIADERYA